MKIRALLLLGLLSMALALLVAAITPQPVAAQVCYGPNDPNKQNPIPCPEEQKKRPTIVYPSFTPSATVTSTPAPTETLTPQPSVTPTATPVAAVVPPAGTDCRSYINSIPAGAILFGLGGLILVGGSRPGFSPIHLQRGSAETNKAINDWSRNTTMDDSSPLVAVIIRSARGVTIRNAVIGTGVAGTGAGLLGAGVLAAAVGFNCVGAPIMLPAAAMAGLAAAVAALRGVVGRPIPKKWWLSDYLFWPAGEMEESGEVDGDAGTYKPKDLE